LQPSTGFIDPCQRTAIREGSISRRYSFLGSCRQTLAAGNALAPEKDGKTFKDRVKDAVMEKALEEK